MPLAPTVPNGRASRRRACGARETRRTATPTPRACPQRVRQPTTQRGSYRNAPALPFLWKQLAFCGSGDFMCAARVNTPERPLSEYLAEACEYTTVRLGVPAAYC